MTDALPSDTPELVPAAAFDSARLIAAVRAGDPDGIRDAYRRTFGTDLGRTVLLHLLSDIGRIGQARAAETPAESNHTNGRGWAALEIARLAGFDPVAIAAAGLTQTLEGASHEHGYGHQPDHGRGPSVVFGDEHAGFDGGAADGDGDLLDPAGGDFGG